MQDERETLRIALWGMLDEVDGGREALAAEVARIRGWESSAETWLSVLSRWTSASDGRDAPGWVLSVAQRVLVPMGARDRIAPIQARSAFEAQQEAEGVALQRPTLRKVEPAAKRDRRRA